MNALERLGKKSIRVTDLAGQYWCEKKVELKLRYKEKPTEETASGKEIHEALESRTNAPIELKPVKYSDYVYKVLYANHIGMQMLARNRVTREFSVFGEMDGFPLTGKIDELHVREGKLFIIDDKTKRESRAPKEEWMTSDKLQVMFYRKLLGSMHSGAYTLASFASCNNLERLPLTPEFTRQLQAQKIPYELSTVKAIAARFFSEVAELPEISNTLYIRYREQATGKVIKLYKFDYNENEIQGAEHYLFPYWKGEREARPVPEEEKWKCKICDFYGNHCKVWWKDRQAGLVVK